MDIPMEVIVYLLAVLGGLQSILAGGSFLILIPAYILMGFDPLSAMLIGRLMLVGSLGTGTFHFMKSGHIEWKRTYLLGLGMAFGYMVGSAIAVYHPGLLAIFLPIMLAIGVVMMFVRPPAPKQHVHRPVLLPTLGTGLGIMGSMGGGTGVFVPILLVWVYGMEFKKAVMQTRYMDAFIHTLTVAVLVALGVHISWTLAAATFFGGITGGYLGTHVMLKIPTKVLKIVIAAVSVVLFIHAFM